MINNNTKARPSTARHIGPVAQDFYAAFGVGEDDRHISTTDADGVAMVAIQGLYEVVRWKRGSETEGRCSGIPAGGD